jgi:hypothetical protein
MKRNSALLAFLSLASLTTACGVTKNMDDLSSSTNKMSATTDKMATSTDQMAGTTKSLSKTTDAMAATTEKMSDEMAFTYSDMRTSNTRQARQDALGGMEKSTDSGTKMGYASEYFASMDYQFWKPEVENAPDRESLKTLAVSDFFVKVRNYISDRTIVSPLDPNLKDPNFSNLDALAGSLQYINLAQLSALKDAPAAKPVSMLSMIEDGLKMKSDLESGKVSERTVPASLLEVIRNEQDAEYLLKVRQNYLKAMALSLAPSSKNSVQLEYLAKVLESANRTENTLKALSIDPETDAKLTAGLAQMAQSYTTLPTAYVATKNSPLPTITDLQAMNRVSKALSAVLAK